MSEGCLLTGAEAQGGGPAMQAKDKTLLGVDQTLLAPLADKADWSKVLFLVSVLSSVELL